MIFGMLLQREKQFDGMLKQSWNVGAEMVIEYCKVIFNWTLLRPTRYCPTGLG